MLNAVKFTPDGGQVTLSANRTPTGVEIRVSDTGTGIEESCRAQVFEPFFTGFDVSHHSSGHYEYGRRGLGLGLSIARAFIEMHGGTIACESELGTGSTFLIWLPADARREAGALRRTLVQCHRRDKFRYIFQRLDVILRYSEGSCRRI